MSVYSLNFFLNSATISSGMSGEFSANLFISSFTDRNNSFGKNRCVLGKDIWIFKSRYNLLYWTYASLCASALRANEKYDEIVDKILTTILTPPMATAAVFSLFGNRLPEPTLETPANVLKIITGKSNFTARFVKNASALLWFQA